MLSTLFKFLWIALSVVNQQAEGLTLLPRTFIKNSAVLLSI